MRRLAVLLVTVFALLPAGLAHARTSLVSVPIDGGGTVVVLERLGLDVTHDVTERRARVLLYSDEERRRLEDAGFTATEVIADVDAATAQARAASPRALSGLPSRRDDYRYLSDYTNELRLLEEEKPGLVRRIDLPRKSVEGRPITGVEIASNVNRTDDGRPAYVVMGLHHAREWPSGEVNMEFALDLARGYGSDPRISALLDRVRVYVFPVINPDGFLVSRGNLVPPVPPTKPLQRKNCQYDASGPSEPCANRESVDLNRNYGAFWGGNGASEEPGSDLYRGTGPWSEPESAAVHEFSQSRHITNFQSIHNIAALVLRPPGFKAFGLAPDEARLKDLGDRMGAVTGYASEYGYELYEVTGATEDWNYVAQNAFGYTIELGGGGGLPTFQGPYDTHVVQQYLGADRSPAGDDGVREALLLAGEQAADTRDHSVVQGTAPPGTVLRLAKTFTTTTSPICETTDADTNCATTRPAFEVPDKLDTQLAVPASGRYEWHVNPSTRPFVRKAGQTESWTFTCEDPDGRLLERRQLTIAIGERRTENFTCGTGAGGGTGSGEGGAGGGGGTTGSSFRLRVAGGRQRLSTVLRRGVLVRATCSSACRTRSAAHRRTTRGLRLGRRAVTFSRAGTRSFRVRLTKAGRRSLRRSRVSRLGLIVRARDLRSGALRTGRASVRLRR